MAIDKVVVLSGDPVAICDGITVYQPTLREIKDYGESKFFSTFWTFCSSPWDMPSMLDDMGVNFMEITEWELFRSIAIGLSQEVTKPIFGDLDFSKFVQMTRKMPDGETDVVLYNKETQQIIDEEMYKAFIPFVREAIGFEHSGKKAGNEYTRKALIIDDRKTRKRNARKPYESALFNGIISLVNTEECKYDYNTIFNITLYQFTKSITQIQGKKSACALLQGSISGFCDTSKIPKIDFQWMYSDKKYNSPRGHKLFTGEKQAIQQAGAVK
jgi:hypothetical protein